MAFDGIGKCIDFFGTLNGREIWVMERVMISIVALPRSMLPCTCSFHGVGNLCV